ncbi:MAG TPA: pyridoxamine 5'-phosphate oxidase family protein [Patescibacteria group bacterium]|nr:pyridoxamine 5'-phosphate oxidase family protein [Patescibacteria group bacterium]
MNKAHIDRVKEELKAVGFSSYGLLKMEVRKLPQVIHDDEHIHGAVYGQIGHATSAMMVATDKRVIFVDSKPFFNTADEITYGIVSGVKMSKAALGCSVVLHTRIGDYSFKFVNAKCARIFVEYIETKRIEEGLASEPPIHETAQSAEPTFADMVDKDGIDFLKNHDLGVLSTIDRTGNVHGAIIYYVTDQNNFIYILTKSDTGKGRNILAHNQVALTIHEPGTQKTAQIQGIAEVEIGQKVKDEVFNLIVKARPYGGKLQLPPVTKLHEGFYMVIKIKPTLVKYNDYSQKN